MVGVRSDLANFIIDLEDEECPEFAVHVAAYQGQLEELEALLKDESVRAKCLNARIRPFGATPLRLAATGASPKALSSPSTDNDACLERFCRLTTNSSAWIAPH